MIDDAEFESLLRNTSTGSVPDNAELVARLGTVSRMINEAQGDATGRRLLLRLGEFVVPIVLKPGGVVLGRESPANLVIPLAKLSRKHFEVLEDEHGNMAIRDLDSTNGTRVNGKLLKEPHSLLNGDLIEAGGLDFAYID